MAPAQSRRRHVFIKKGFQKRFIGKMMLIVFLSNIIFGALVFILANNHMSSIMYMAHITTTQVFAELENALVWAIMIGSIISMILSSILTIFIVTYSIHRIAGPLYKFESACKEIGEGNFNAHTVLRDDDELKDLSKAFGLMIDSLKSQKMKRVKVRQDIRMHLKMAHDYYLTDDQKSSLKDIEKILMEWEKQDSAQK